MKTDGSAETTFRQAKMFLRKASSKTQNFDSIINDDLWGDLLEWCVKLDEKIRREISSGIKEPEDYR